MNDVGYLSLTKKIMQDELTNEELINCLDMPNVPLIQQTILKLIEKKICASNISIKLLEYSKCMDKKFKILGLCRIGHLAIYALKKLGYLEEFKELYVKLSDEDKEQIEILEKTLF